MSDINVAKPNDVFVDASGKLWRVIGVRETPTVMMVEIEPDQQPPCVMSGGIGGLMWDGFKLIYRKERSHD